MVANVIQINPFLSQFEIKDEESDYPLIKMDRKTQKEKELAHQCRCRNRLKEKQNMKYVWFNIKIGTELV